MSSGPPNKYPQWVNLAGLEPGEPVANALGAAQQKFMDTYGVWANQVEIVGTYAYLGAYWPTE